MINKAFENGEEKYKARDFEGAIMDFTLALEKDPGNPEILYQRAMSYFHLGKKSLALIDMDEAVEMQPNYSFRYSSRAFMRDSFGDVIGAIKDYKEAINLDPEDAISYNNLGVLEDKMGKRNISQGHYDKADSLLGLSSNKEMKKMTETGATINYDRPQSDLPPVVAPTNEISFWKAITMVFTDKSTFNEFIAFVKSGFKLKN
jgi:tetratricopeptide (TPR) repeat protein